MWTIRLQCNVGQPGERLLVCKAVYVTFITSGLEETARNVENSYILQETEDM